MTRWSAKFKGAAVIDNLISIHSSILSIVEGLNGERISKRTRIIRSILLILSDFLKELFWAILGFFHQFSNFSTFSAGSSDSSYAYYVPLFF